MVHGGATASHIPRDEVHIGLVILASIIHIDEHGSLVSQLWSGWKARSALIALFNTALMIF